MLLNLVGFKNLYNTNQPIKRNNSSFYFNTANSKIKPLQRDTISFSSSKILLNRISRTQLDNNEACSELIKHASNAFSILNGKMNKMLLPYMTFNNKDGIIQSYKTRVKSLKSLSEKIQSEYDYFISNNLTPKFDPSDEESIKSFIGDVIGSRIILSKTSQNDTKKLIDILIDEVNKGNLNITKIQSYEPKEPYTGLKYFSDIDLKRFQNAVNQNKPLDKQISLIQKTKDSGYTALHIDVDLSSPELSPKFNGYKGEIQIMGPELEEFKEAQQDIYKLRYNKSIGPNEKIYKPVKRYFNKFINQDKKYPDVKKYFDEYTRRSFVEQRKVELGLIDKNDDLFPTIETCGLTGLLPKELDFNNIHKIKTFCNEAYFQ